MLELFDNETEQGELYISYPMGEAMRDIGDTVGYLTRSVTLQQRACKTYKSPYWGLSRYF